MTNSSKSSSLIRTILIISIATSLTLLFVTGKMLYVDHLDRVVQNHPPVALATHADGARPVLA